MRKAFFCFEFCHNILYNIQVETNGFINVGFIRSRKEQLGNPEVWVYPPYPPYLFTDKSADLMDIGQICLFAVLPRVI